MVIKQEMNWLFQKIKQSSLLQSKIRLISIDSPYLRGNIKAIFLVVKDISNLCGILISLKFNTCIKSSFL